MNMNKISFEQFKASFPSKPPKDYTNGFTYLLAAAGHDVQSFHRETRYDTPTTIYNLVRGITKVERIRYGDLQDFAKILHIQSVDDLVLIINYIEDQWGVITKKVRAGKVASLEQIVLFQKEYGRLDKEKCEAIAYHAKMKTRYRRINNSFDLQTLLQEACNKVDLKSIMIKHEVPVIKDFYGHAIVQLKD